VDHLELVLCSARIAEDAFDTDVPAARFERCLRLAVGRKYPVRRVVDRKRVLMRDLVLEEDAAGADGSGADAEIRVYRCTTTGVAPLSGGVCVALASRRQPLPFSKVPCASSWDHGTRFVRRLEMRLPAAGATLVFSMISEGQRLVRRVGIELFAASVDACDRATQKAVNDAVQAVLMPQL
jgi:hypothetical protein